jgi:DNA polymerase-1
LRQYEAEGERAAALAKLEAVPGRFALIHHTVSTVDAGTGTAPIGLESLEAGIRLAEWFANETDRVYAILAESAEETSIRKLVELVTRLANRNKGRVTVKILQRANQRKYETADAAKADLERLVALELGDWEQAPKRPTGGWQPSYFTPRPRPCVTRDSSYSCPEDGDEDDDTPPRDDGPDGPPNDPDPTRDSRPPSAETAYGCDEKGERADRRGYEASRVTHDRESGNRGSTAAPSDQARVTHGAEHESHTTDPTAYTLVTTPAGLATLAEVVTGWNGAVGLDTETTGLDPLTDRVRLVQVAVGEGVAVIDVFALPSPRVDLAPLFAALTDKEVIAHNAQFDLRFLRPLGYVPGRTYCTMLASRILYAGEREEVEEGAAGGARLKHSLEDAVERELGKTLDKGEQKSDWSGSLTAQQFRYAAGDAAPLLSLAKVLKKKLAAANLTATADLEMGALLGIAWAAPVHVDRAAWLAIADSAKDERARLSEAMDALAPNPAGLETRNWDSPTDVKKAFKQVGVTVTATDDDTLAGIDHALACLLRDYRGFAKRVNTYGSEWLNKHVDREGRVLPSWNQCGTESGRMSCSDPNLQQIPRGSEYRQCFVARSGHVLVKADYSQVELRFGAKVANEAVMIAAYKEGRDLHTLTAARILDKPEADVQKSDRQLAKAVNFGLLFGMGWRGLKRYAKANYGVELTDRQAQAYRTAFFKAYPALEKWHIRTEAEVSRLFRADPTGTHDTYTLRGRRRILPVAKRDSEGKPYPNKTDALNTPVQGSAADGLKQSIAFLWERREECPTAVPVIFCHDEIVLEVPEADADRAADWLRRCMVAAVAPLIDPVPIEVEIRIGRTWAGADKPAATPSIWSAT